jgi:23S rRNA pseudouridine2605 synthase
MPAERLQKVLARAGYGSRRAAEALIAAGRVRVNGAVATLGAQADPATDRIEVDGRPVAAPAIEVTLALHKPEGYVVTRADEQGRPTVYDLLPGAPPHLRYVGRLDVATSGLLLLTTDGELAHRLTHPRYRVEKVYDVLLDEELPAEASDRLVRGVRLEDGMTAPAVVERRGERRIRITIVEGRNRQVRRMCEAVGRRVVWLRRVAVGPIRLGGLAAGASRPLTAPEEAALRRLVGLPPAGGA